jgi:hypothetical protein
MAWVLRRGGLRCGAHRPACFLAPPRLKRLGPLGPARDRSGAARPGLLTHWLARRASGAWSPLTRPSRWPGRQWLTDGREAAGSSVRAPPLSGGCAEQGSWRWGLPKQRRSAEATENPQDSGEEACTVAADGTTIVLHPGERERERKVRWGPKMIEEARASGSPSGRTTVASQRKLGRGATTLPFEAGGPIPGRTGRRRRA